MLLQMEAAHLPEQSVSNAVLTLSPCEHFARVFAQDGVGERILLRAQGRFNRGLSREPSRSSACSPT